jgi:hypothetical protein
VSLIIYSYLHIQTCQPAVLVVKTTGFRPKYLVDLMDILT